MISISGKIWTQQKVNKNLVEKIKQDHDLGDILSQLIISRNYDTSEIHGIHNNQKLINIFNSDNELLLDGEIIQKAKKAINRMIEFEDKYYQKKQRVS